MMSSGELPWISWLKFVEDETECVPGLPFRLAFELIDMGFEGYVKHEICDSDTYFTPSFRYEHPEKVKAFYQMV